MCHCVVGSFYHKVSQAPALISQGKCSECSLLHLSCLEPYLKENNSNAVFLFVVIGVLVRALMRFGCFERGVLLFFMKIQVEF